MSRAYADLLTYVLNEQVRSIDESYETLIARTPSRAARSTTSGYITRSR